MRRSLMPLALATMMLGGAASVFAQDSVYIEELTWVEARDAIKAGKTTVILPTGGTEQNGSHFGAGEGELRRPFQRRRDRQAAG